MQVGRRTFQALFLFVILLGLGKASLAQDQIPIINARAVIANTNHGHAYFKVTVSANATVFIDGIANSSITVVFRQDAIGGRNVTFDSSIQNPCSVATTPNAVTTCSFQYDASANVWNGVSASGGGGTSNPSANAIVVSTSCPSSAPANCFQVFADTQYVTDAVWTSGSTTVTSATANFQCPGGTFPCSSGGDAGKIVFGFSTAGGNAMGQTTIASVTNATTIVLSVAAGATQPSAGVLVFGHDDTTALQNAYAALIANRKCQPSALLLPAGYMLVQGHVGGATPPAACNSLTTLNDNGSGITVQGFGAHSTKLIPTPNFSLAAGGDTGYFFSGGPINIRDVGFWGGQNVASAGTFALPTIALSNDAYLQNVKIEGWQPSVCCTQAVNIGTTNNNNGSLINVYINQAGYVNIVSGNNGITLVNTFCSEGVNSSGSLVNDFGGYYNQGSGLSSTLLFIQGTGTYNCYGCFITPVAGGVAVRLNGTANTLNLYSSLVDGSGASSFGIFWGTANTVNSYGGTVIKGNATNGALTNTSNVAATFHDDGTTQFTWGTASTFFGHTGTQFNIDANSVRGACTGVATASSTLGLYGTGPNVTASTCTSTAIGTGIVMNGARTLQGLVVSASAAGVNASSGVVTVMKNGVATTITCTVGTGTSCQNFTNTVSTADGDLISLQFTTQVADTLAGLRAAIIFK